MVCSSNLSTYRFGLISLFTDLIFLISISKIKTIVLIALVFQLKRDQNQLVNDSDLFVLHQ